MSDIAKEAIKLLHRLGYPSLYAADYNEWHTGDGPAEAYFCALEEEARVLCLKIGLFSGDPLVCPKCNAKNSLWVWGPVTKCAQCDYEKIMEVPGITLPPRDRWPTIPVI